MSRFRWLKNSSFSVAACLVLLCSTTAQALTIQLSLSELTGLADTIVVGTVVSRSSRWNAEHNNIYTEVVVAVTDNLKGKSGKKTVAIIVPGGTVGDIEQWVEDTATFEVGEQVGLFLEDLNSAKVSKMGLDTASQMAADGSVGRIIGGLQGKRTLAKDNQSPDKRISADTFKQQVQMALDGQAVPEVENKEFIEGTTPDLQIFTISPTSVSAGTATLVTVTGSGFGTPAPGFNGLCFLIRRVYNSSVGGYVSHFYCNPYVSWSDTQISAYVPVCNTCLPIVGYAYSAASGPIFVNKGNTSGPLVDFTVTFGYMGRDWFGNSPNITYKVNDGGVAGRSAAVQAAADTWSNAGAKFTFTYGGTHTKMSKGYTGVNEVLWMSLTAGTLGEATVWSDPTTGEILEVDFAFNSNSAWSYAVTCPPGQYDAQSIATHEMGHWLSLRDLYGDYPGFTQDTAKVMYGVENGGAITKRTLHAHDILGIKWIYGATEPSWSRLTVDNPETMAVYGRDLYAGFGAIGLWKWNGTAWTRLSLDNPENMVTSGLTLYADFGAKGLWKWDGTAWSLLSWDNPENMVTYDSTLYADFGLLGLWRWDGTAWTRLSVDNPENMLVWWGQGLLVDFGAKGLWKWDGAAWSLLSWDNPENMVVDAGWWPYVDFGALGVWAWYGNAGWYRLTVDNPEKMVAHDNNLYADFGAKGLWKYDGSAWSRPTASNPETMLISGPTLYADLGPSGLWMWDRSAWTRLTVDNLENMVASDSSLYVDFGAKGLWKWDN